MVEAKSMCCSVVHNVAHRLALYGPRYYYHYYGRYCAALLQIGHLCAVISWTRNCVSLGAPPVLPLYPNSASMSCGTFDT